LFENTDYEPSLIDFGQNRRSMFAYSEKCSHFIEKIWRLLRQGG